MNQERYTALFFILFGIAAAGFGVWQMFEWSAAYEAAIEYPSVISEAARRGTTLYPLQESPPIGGGLLGVLSPVFMAIIGTGLASLGIHTLDKAP